MTVSGTQPAAFPPAAQTAEPAQVGKEAFLKLLIAQIRHQDPMNPSDGVQFLTQLAQFSELEQLMEMRKDLQIIRERYETAEPAETTKTTSE